MISGSSFSRRGILQFASAILPLGMVKFSTGVFGVEAPVAASDGSTVRDGFPAYAPELVRELVLVSHFNLNRVKELVEARPALAVAAWDWGFGDSESALGAASHMGNRPIADYLISRGARPSLFSAAMLGQLDVVKAFVAAQPGVQRIRGPHGISLLAHARMGGDAARPVYSFLESLGDADSGPAVPLPDADAAKIVGTYVFGVGQAQQIEVNADTKAYGTGAYPRPPQLNWTRKGTTTRPLFHLGENVFHPAGAPAARIRFAEEGGAMVMTVTDADIVVVAKKG